MKRTAKFLISFIVVLAVFGAVTVTALAAYKFGVFITNEGFRGNYSASLLIDEDDVDASLDVTVKNEFYPAEATVLSGIVTGIDPKTGDCVTICVPSALGDLSCSYRYEFEGYTYIEGSCDYYFYTEHLCTLTA